MGLIILLAIFILLLVAIIKGCRWVNNNISEPQPTTVRSTTATAPLPDPPSSNVVRSSTSSNTNSSKRHHRVAIGNILIDNDDNLADTDEMEVDEDEEKNVSKVLTADFGDGNVHPIDDVACTICLVNYQHGDRIQRNAFECYTTSVDTDVIEARCDHVFHPECITNWVKTSTNSNGECPICRRVFVILPPV
jgi:Anaphase-promoting complex subunit 11 RING-H2 finger